MNGVNASWQSVDSGGSPMRLYVARPENAQAGVPCILVQQEAFGLNDYMQDVTRRFAALGYVAVAPELFHRTAPNFIGDYNDLGKSMPHMKALTNPMIEEDVRATFDWLTRDGQADVTRAASVGFCLGGKVSFIANAALQLRAAVSYYGSSIPSLLDDYAEAQQAPLLLVWGGQDKHISPEERTRVTDRLRDAGKRFINAEFSQAQHGFFCDARQSYDPEASREAWALLVAYLQDKFKAA